MKKITIAALIIAAAISQTAALADGGSGSTGGSISTDMYPGDWITISDWALEYVNAYRDTGLMPIYLQNYEITDYTADITRVQFCELMEPILNAKGYLNKDSYTASFTDCDNYAAAVLADIGIITGTSDTTFEPDRTITREEAAVILARLLDYTDTYRYEITDSIYHYRDERDFSDWAKKSIYAVYNAKIMNGTGDNYFSPRDTYTIEQAVKVAYDLNNLIDAVPAETPSVTELPEQWLCDGYYALTDGDKIYISTSTDKKDSVLTLNASEYDGTDGYKRGEIPYFAANKKGGTAEVYNLKTAKLLFSVPYAVEKLAFDYIITSAANTEGKTSYGVYDYDGNEIEKPALTMQQLREGGYMGASGGGNKAEVSK